MGGQSVMSMTSYRDGSAHNAWPLSSSRFIIHRRTRPTLVPSRGLGLGDSASASACTPWRTTWSGDWPTHWHLSLAPTTAGEVLFLTSIYPPYSGTRGHSVKPAKHSCKLDLRKYFFCERVIDRWNRLNEACVSCVTVNSFKGKLDMVRQKKMGFFEDHSWSDWPSWPHQLDVHWIYASWCGHTR